MTIASTTSRISYTGDGVTVAFTVPFYFQNNADLVISLQDTAGVATVQVLGTNYTLAGATLSAGGTATFVVAPTTGYTISIYRDPQLTQTTSYNNNDPFPAKSHELALDKACTIDQRTRDLIIRAIHLPDAEASTTVTALAPIVTRKNKLLGFDTTGALSYVVGPTFVSATGTGVAVVDSRATASVTTFAGSVNILMTRGGAVVGDGGGLDYVRGTIASPTPFQDGSGVYWTPATPITPVPLLANAVATAMIQDNAVTAAKLASSTVSAVKLTSSSISPWDGMLNGTIVETHAANAVTFTIKTLAGATPSATDPVYFAFRNVTPGTGDYTVRTVTSALSFTISSTSSVGFVNATPGRLWLLAIDNGGTVELGAINCLNGINVYPLQGFGIVTTVAEGGVGAADNAHVVYSTTARTSKAYLTLGYATWDTGATLATAGTWSASPSRIQLYGPGVPLPGTRIQSQRTETGTLATGNTVMPNDNTIPQITEGNEYMTQAITPTSGANLLHIDAQAHLGNNSGPGIYSTMALFQDATANAIAALNQVLGGTDATGLPKIYHIAKRVPSLLITATTFRVRAGGTAATMSFNGINGVQYQGGVQNSYMDIEEIMA